MGEGGERNQVFVIEVATKRQVLPLSGHAVLGWGGAPLGCARASAASEQGGVEGRSPRGKLEISVKKCMYL